MKTRRRKKHSSFDPHQLTKIKKKHEKWHSMPPGADEDEAADDNSQQHSQHPQQPQQPQHQVQPLAPAPPAKRSFVIPALALKAEHTKDKQAPEKKRESIVISVPKIDDVDGPPKAIVRQAPNLPSITEDGHVDSSTYVNILL